MAKDKRLADNRFATMLVAGAFVATGLGVWFGLPGAVLSPSGVFAMVLVYPLLEEWIFRGGLQRWLNRNRTGRAWVSRGNGIASVVFALSHALLLMNPAALWVVLPSLLFGWSLDRTGRLAAPCLLHVSWNGAFWLGAWLMAA